MYFKSERKSFLVLLAILICFFSRALAAQAPENRVVPESESQLIYSYSPLVKKAAPAVVNIYTKKKVKLNAISPLFNDPFFKHFFGGGFLPKQKEKVQNSLGSGVIVSKDGLVITSNHVIRGSDEITVALADRREFEAEIVIQEEKTDLALLKIKDGKGAFPYLEIANSDGLEVGDLVLAIGNPFGVGQTVTSGIVSAVARTTIGVTDYQFFIQTDAAINPGNSGGALINMQGKMVGVNTAIYTKSGGSHGIGFAIPTNMVTALIHAKENGGKVIRPWIGVSMQQVTSEIASSIGLDRPSGALVNSVYEDGPAARAGIKIGDIVVEVDGKKIEDQHELRFRIATYKLGGMAKLKVLRGDEEIYMAVKMEVPPEKPARDTRKLSGQHPLAGATVSNLSPALADEIDMPVDAKGVVVSKAPEGAAASIGIKYKDIVLSINGKEVKSTKELHKALMQVANSWNITLLRSGRELTIRWGRR